MGDTTDKSILATTTARVYVAIGVLALVALAGGAVLFVAKGSADSSIAMVGGIGLVVALLCLAGLIIIARALHLTSDDTALGLPKGSVRALLAFSLVLVFVIVVSWSLDASHAAPQHPIILATGVASSDASSRMASAEARYPAPRFIVSAVADSTASSASTCACSSSSSSSSSASSASKAAETRDIEVIDLGDSQQYFDLQKQVLTVVATLLVSIVSFYFGGKSASEGISATNTILDRMKGVFGPGDANSTSSQPDIPGTLKKINDIAAMTNMLVAGLGSDPMTPWKTAPSTVPAADVQRTMATGQSAVDALKAAANRIATDAQKAQSLAKSATPGADNASLLVQLMTLLQDVTAAQAQAIAAVNTYTDAKPAG